MTMKVILAVHGVGETEVAEPIKLLRDIIAPKSAATYSRNDITLGSTHYAQLQPTDPEQVVLAEMNWSDVQRPRQSFLGFARHVPAIAFALLRLDYGWLKSSASPLLREGYRSVFEGIACWVVFPVLLGLAFSTLIGWSLWGFVAALLLVAGVFTFVAWRWVRFGLLFIGGAACLIALLAVSALLIVRPSLTEDVSRITILIYGVAQFALLLMLLALAGQAGWRVLMTRTAWQTELAFLAFNYLALVLVAFFGCCVWTFGLFFIERLGQSERYEDWSRVFLASVGYNLLWVEWSMAAVTAGIGGFALIGAILYILARKADTATAHGSGLLAQDRIAWMLVLMPLAIAVPGTLMLLTSPWVGRFPPDVESLMKWGVLGIYAIGAARGAPLLLRLSRRLVPVLDVMGDVIFYTAAKPSPLSIHCTCNDRFETLLRHYLTLPGVTSILVVAHSQGTVIAYDVLSQVLSTCKKEVAVSLLSMGSPLGSLYNRFLGLPLAIPLNANGKAAFAWENIYRSGDYVGGDVNTMKARSHCIGRGGHVGYWSDPEVGRILLALL